MPRTPEQFEELREKTKSKILESALTLFATKGYHGTSINDIAKAAGISKGLAYNYFDSKKDIADGILNLILKMGEQLDSMIDWGGDPYKAIHDLISYSFSYVSEEDDFWRFYMSFSLQPTVVEDTKNVAKKFVNKYFTKIEKLFSKIGIPNPKNEAKVLGAIIDGVSLHYFIDKENYSLRAVKNILLKKYSKEALELQRKK